MEKVESKTNDEEINTLSTSSIHHGFMREALNLVRHQTVRGKNTVFISGQAEQALRSDETPVGCVFVYDGRIIGKGMNDTNKSLNVGDFEQQCIDESTMV